MKNKKILFFVIIFLSLGLFPFITKASDCSDLGGSCVPSTSVCPKGGSGQPGFGCPGGQMCCDASPGCCVNGTSCTGAQGNGSCSSGTFQPKACSNIPACSGGGGGGTGSGGGGGTVSTDFPNPLQFNTIEEVLNSLMSHLKGLVATLAILFIVLGGVLYITSAGDESMIKKAKACWTAAVIGMAIVLAGPTFLLEVETVLGGNTSGLQGLTLMQIARNALSLLLSLVGILAIIFLVIGGAMYITAAGDDKKIGTGKKIIEYAVYGVIISMGALIIVRQISTIITK